MPTFKTYPESASRNIVDVDFPPPHSNDEPDRAGLLRNRQNYAAMIENIDRWLGSYLAKLEERGELDNTIVVYSSDHGEMLGDHGIYLKGPFFYDCAIRVPLIVSWPGAIEGGRRSESLIELADLAPTLLDAAGLERHPGMQARSLWPLLAGQADLDRFRDDVYCEYYNAMPSHQDPKAFATMVRSERCKLVLCHGLNEGELYDLASDPAETHNLWDDAAHAGTKTEMLIRLCDRMAQTADPLPPRIGIF